MTTEAETGQICLQSWKAKDCWEPPTEAREELRKGPPLDQRE